MKKLLLALAITLGTFAAQAQATKLTLRNDFTQPITVTINVVNSSCDAAATFTTATPLAVGEVRIIGPLTSDPTDEWAAIRASTAVPSNVLTPPPSSVVASNTACSSCTNLPPYASNGLEATWVPCNDEVRVF